MVSIFHQMFLGCLIEVFLDSSASSRPFKAHVDGVLVGSFASYEVALEVAREQCFALHECFLLERG